MKQHHTGGYRPVVVFLVLFFSSFACGAGEGSPLPIRGTLPWHNFLSGPTAWNEEDYRRYLDRMKDLDLNLVAFHCYTGGAERYAPYVEPLIRIQYRNIVPRASLDTSLTARWGYRPLAVKDFAFGTSRLFELPEGAGAFGARCAILARDNEDRYRRAQGLLRRALEMAHRRGIQFALGFEFGIHPLEFWSAMPPGSMIPGALLPDPTHPASIEILRAAIDDILRAYPGIDWIWLWLHEHTMYVGRARLSGRFRKIHERDAPLFVEAGNEEAAFNGVWSLEYIRRAWSYLKERAPRVRVAISGWGGGAQLPVILKGLDRALPREIVFTCLNPGQGWKAQADLMARIAENREVWAIPWLEGDAKLWHLQPRVALLQEQVQLARKQKLNGVLAIHWRTEEVRLNLEAFARAASRSGEGPSVEEIYREDCLRRFGEESVSGLAPLLARMDREQWMNGPNSPEYFPYDPGWGRVTPELEKRLKELLQLVRGLQGRAANPEHRSNLDWLAANFQFTLLLDGVGRNMEPAYRLRERWIAGEIDQNGLMENLEDARRSLERAPLEELFGVFSRRVRSRGELGELSALNQKLWLQYLELKEFLKEARAGE